MSTATMNERTFAIPTTAIDALRRHWPEYLMEAFGLGLFMVSACSVGVVLEHPSSPVHQMIQVATLRRVLFGAAMGVTAILNIYSPWGKRSGSHLNPATTLTFWRLGKVERWDAVFYPLSQFAGGLAGVIILQIMFGSLIAHPNVNYVATTPGPKGEVVAFVAEVLITFILISVVLRVSNVERLARYTGFFVGALVTTYISIEAPLSGMSMNPARTLASAAPAGVWTALWIYFTAPPIGMLLAAEVYLRLKGEHRVFCAKLHHHNSKRCIFRCNFGELLNETASPSSQERQLTAQQPPRSGLSLGRNVVFHPDGIAFSPDEKYLYVGDWDENKKVVMRYEAKPDGTLANGKVFFDMTSAPGEDALDGIKVDQAENLYVSGPGGLWVISAERKHLGTIIAPKHPHNMAWGDEDGWTLYLCARSGLYRMRLDIAGTRPTPKAE